MTAHGPREASGLDDFDRIVISLNNHQVDFMIIGGYAVVYHGHVRNTQDLDLYVRPTEENARRTVAALQEAGFSSPELTPGVFTTDNGISLGEEPVKVDIISHLPGVVFEEAWSRRESSVFGPEIVNYISRKDLIANKRAVGRPRDLDDVRELEGGQD
jgi:hypothetical protein